MSGYKVFINNTPLTAEDVNDKLMEQVVIVFNDATERNTALPAPSEGMHVHLLSTGRTYFYASGSWIELMPGMVSGLTARTILVCTSSTRPSHAAGRFIYETDTDRVYVSTGTIWRTPSGPSATMITGTSTQAISTASYTKIVLNSPGRVDAQHFTHNTSTGELTCQRTAWYLICGQVYYEVNATLGNRRLAGVYLNGNIMNYSQGHMVPAGGTVRQPVNTSTRAWHLDIGDVIALGTYQDSGIDQSVLKDSTSLSAIYQHD